jgi:RNA 2',3'-cyclic 3'-phosphodiesterase
MSQRGQPPPGPDSAASRNGPDDGASPSRLRRVFVAIPLPEAAMSEVAAIIDVVRSAADPEVRDVRWVRLDGLHLTLRFIGQVDDAGLRDVGDATERAAARIAPFEVAIEGAGAFPSVARPRALWLDVTEGGNELAAAAAAVDDELAAAGLERSGREYRAHLTVARADGIRAGPDVARRLIDEASGRRTAFPAKELVLFETIQGGGPARYVALRTAHLSGADVARDETAPAGPR